MAGQKNFNATAKKLVGRGIARTYRLGLKTSAPPVEPGRKHPGIVENHEIRGTEQVGKVTELAVLKLSGGCGEQEQARTRAIG